MVRTAQDRAAVSATLTGYDDLADVLACRGQRFNPEMWDDLSACCSY